MGDCYVEVKDLGFAKPSVEALEPVPLHTVSEQRTQTEAKNNSSFVITVVCTVAAAMLLLFALYITRSRRTTNVSLKSVEATQSYEIKVASSMEAGEPVKAVNVEEDDKNSESTICPSPSNDDKQSDIQSEQSQQSLRVAACNGSKAIRRSPNKFDSDGLESPKTRARVCWT